MSAPAHAQARASGIIELFSLQGVGIEGSKVVAAPFRICQSQLLKSNVSPSTSYL